MSIPASDIVVIFCPWLQISLTWVRSYVRKALNWRFRVSITTAQKLTQDWKEQMALITARVAYLVKAYNIHRSLVVSADQTGIHLVPTGGSRTYEKKGVRDVAVTGKDDKRQITAVVSSAADGGVLPLQLIFTGKTRRSVSAGAAARDAVKLVRWDLTYSANHWSNLETTKQWVKNVPAPHVERSCEDLGRDAT
jgi:prophage DNA circulation protein